MKKNIFYNFLKCGIIGWCMEVVFTSIHSFRKKDYRLMGHTSIWMFPIYGMASIIKPISFELKKHHVKRTERGLLYTLGIFSAEFISGCMLKKAFKCPWDYSKCKYNIKGVIRLDYAPIWFVVGLFYENVLNKESKNKR